jgi:hypothetical protein
MDLINIYLHIAVASVADSGFGAFMIRDPECFFLVPKRLIMITNCWFNY